MAHRRIKPEQGMLALNQVLGASPAQADALATAVRFTLEELAQRAPGRSVEVRVPPFGATQCIAGLEHRRGTPPNVVETDPDTWIGLVSGQISWQSALASGALIQSGALASEVARVLPLFD